MSDEKDRRQEIADAAVKQWTPKVTQQSELVPTAGSAAGVIDTEHRDNPICPYCGHLRKDAWEINFGPGIEGWNEITCGNCEKEYFVERHCTVTYSTRKLPNNPTVPTEGAAKKP